LGQEDSLDPERILRVLPDREREIFLAQYRRAVDGAHDPAGWKHLQRFLRLWAGRAISSRGTGLAGLKDRVAALRGRIFLDSPPGAGTSLRVELPLTASDGGVITSQRDSLVTISPLGALDQVSAAWPGR
jgi:Family of unknown function (DUF6247)